MMMKYPNRLLQLMFWCLVACFVSSSTPNVHGPKSPGESDQKAVEIAKAVMKAMGGQQAWDNTHYISWNFFGSRSLVWDKWTGMVRIEWLKKDQKILVNLNDGTGKVQLNGVAQNNPDTLAKYLNIGKEVWINDGYWLFMPYKLLDPGVTLKYLGQSDTEKGEKSHLLQLTFNQVGVTPENKYHIWVDKKSHLVIQWAFFQNFKDKSPRFTNPWADYKQYSNILLSGDRGRADKSLYPIEVLNEVPTQTFMEF